MSNLQLDFLKEDFNRLQDIYWDKNLDPIYWWWEIKNPDICLVFMNPTWKNVSSNKKRKWIKAPWIWTKNIWKMFFWLWFIDENLYNKIIWKKSEEWTEDFSFESYSYLKNKSIYVTNLSKSTQIDARPLKNSVFKEYLPYFKKEIEKINPKIIITFWNQVSSITLWKNIKVWESRKKSEELIINWNVFKVYPVYYPVWQWMRNMWMAKEDIEWIIKNELNK